MKRRKMFIGRALTENIRITTVLTSSSSWALPQIHMLSFFGTRCDWKTYIDPKQLENAEILLQIENPLTAYSLQISNTYVSSPIIIVITGAAQPNQAIEARPILLVLMACVCLCVCTFTLRHLSSIERCVKSHHVWQIFYQTTILALNALSMCLCAGVRMYRP